MWLPSLTMWRGFHRSRSNPAFSSFYSSQIVIGIFIWCRSSIEHVQITVKAHCWVVLIVELCYATMYHEERYVSSHVLRFVPSETPATPYAHSSSFPRTWVLPMASTNLLLQSHNYWTYASAGIGNWVQQIPRTFHYTKLASPLQTKTDDNT